MKLPNKTASFLFGLFTLVSVPAFAVTVTTLTPSVASPQPIGKTITFTSSASDTGTGPVAFQYNITAPGGLLEMVKDFLPGKQTGSTWVGPSFVWVPTGIEGTYSIQVVAKDFGANKSSSKTISYVVSPVVTGSTPVVEKTANPLVAIFSAPSCAK
jgi:hypothetical protein